MKEWDEKMEEWKVSLTFPVFCRLLFLALSGPVNFWKRKTDVLSLFWITLLHPPQTWTFCHCWLSIPIVIIEKTIIELPSWPCHLSCKIDFVKTCCIRFWNLLLEFIGCWVLWREEFEKPENPVNKTLESWKRPNKFQTNVIQNPRMKPEMPEIRGQCTSAMTPLILYYIYTPLMIYKQLFTCHTHTKLIYSI